MSARTWTVCLRCARVVGVWENDDDCGCDPAFQGEGWVTVREVVAPGDIEETETAWIVRTPPGDIEEVTGAPVGLPLDAPAGAQDAGAPVVSGGEGNA